MAFAADAVADPIAPPPRPASAKAAPSDPAETSFDDHLDAAAGDAPEDSVAAKDDKANPTECAATPAPQPEAAAPVLVQLIAAAPAAPVTAPQTPAPASAPDAPPPAEAAAPTAPAVPIVPTAPEAAPEIAPANDVARPHEKVAVKGDATTAEEEAPVQDTVAPVPSEPTPLTPPPAAPTATPAPASATTILPAQAEQAVQAAAPVPVTSAPTNTTREAPAKTTKIEASAQPKADAPERGSRVEPPQPVSAKDNGAKNAPVALAGKDAAAAAPAHETAAPASNVVALTTQTIAHHAALDQSAARAAPLAAAQVGHEIVRRFNGQNMQFDMRLDPPDLGRVDIRLEVSRDHRVTAVVSADSPQALSELSRHARELQHTLESAGLELSDSGLSFDLRQGSERGDRAENDRAGAPSQTGSDDAPQEPTPRARPLGMERWRGVRVDVMV